MCTLNTSGNQQVRQSQLRKRAVFLPTVWLLNSLQSFVLAKGPDLVLETKTSFDLAKEALYLTVSDRVQEVTAE